MVQSVKRDILEAGRREEIRPSTRRERARRERRLCRSTQKKIFLTNAIEELGENLRRHLCFSSLLEDEIETVVLYLVHDYTSSLSKNKIYFKIKRVFPFIFKTHLLLTILLLIKRF